MKTELRRIYDELMAERNKIREVEVELNDRRCELDKIIRKIDVLVTRADIEESLHLLTPSEEKL